MLKLKNVAKYYHSNDVVAMGLRKVNLEFEIGEFVAVTGESGSGKSTLLNVISGLDSYEEGELYINKEETSYYSIEEWEAYRRQYIGFVFQDYNIIDSYSVFENVMIALKIQGYDKETRKQRAEELIDRVGLTSHLHHKASKLSGGQKQRAVIARALAKDCPIIVCDEPTGNLDSESSKNILNLLYEISKDKLVIVVTHNYDEVRDFATRRIRLFDGEVVEDKVFEKVDPSETKTEVAPYFLNLFSLITIAIRNLIRTPRRTIFTTVVFTFIVAVFTLVYGFFVNVTNSTDASGYNFVFNNVTDNRVIVTKYDQTPFTPEELATINDLNRVIYVNNHDVMNDTTVYFYQKDEYYIDVQPAYINPAIVLSKIDLSDGEPPSSKYDIVVQDDLGYQVDDIIYIDYAQKYFMSDVDFDSVSESTLFADKIPFRVSGLVKPTNLYSWVKMFYFHQDFIEDPTTISHSYLGSRDNQIYEVTLDYGDYSLIGLNYSTLVIDDTIPDGSIQLSDGFIGTFEWYADEYFPDVDFESNPTYYLDLDFNLVSSSSFDTFTQPISISGIYTGGGVDEWEEVYAINTNTYNNMISSNIYQITAYASEAYDAELIVENLEDLGFNAIYPQNVSDPFTILAKTILSVVFGGLMLILLIGIYFIVYMVLRNIQQSKIRDFLILRSIGANKSSLNKITIIELLLSTVFSYGIVLLFLYLQKLYRFVPMAGNIMNYFTWGNYLFLTFLLLYLAYLLGSRFNKRIFNQSVITSLKSE